MFRNIYSESTNLYGTYPTLKRTIGRHIASFPLDPDSPVVILAEFFSPQLKRQDSLAFQNRLQVQLQVIPHLLIVRVWPYKPSLRSQNSRVSVCPMVYICEGNV